MAQDVCRLALTGRWSPTCRADACGIAFVRFSVLRNYAPTCASSFNGRAPCASRVHVCAIDSASALFCCPTAAWNWHGVLVCNHPAAAGVFFPAALSSSDVVNVSRKPPCFDDGTKGGRSSKPFQGSLDSELSHGSQCESREQSAGLHTQLPRAGERKQCQPLCSPFGNPTAMSSGRSSAGRQGPSATALQRDTGMQFLRMRHELCDASDMPQALCSSPHETRSAGRGRPAKKQQAPEPSQRVASPFVAAASAFQWQWWPKRKNSKPWCSTTQSA